MKAPAPFRIFCDTREQTPPAFPEGVVVERVTLDAADYTTPALQGIAAIERKSVCDFASTITRGRERFDDELRRLREYRWKLVVVEGDITNVYAATAAHPNSILGTVASLMARWDCPTLFAGNEVGAGRLIAGVLRRWEERLDGESRQTIARPEGNPFVDSLDARGYVTAGDAWARVALGAAERARDCWSRAGELTEKASQGFRDLVHTIGKGEATEDPDLWDRIRALVERERAA